MDYHEVWFKGGRPLKKKKIIYAQFLIGFFLSQVKFNFKTLFVPDKFMIFLYIYIYIKSCSYFFHILFENFHFPTSPPFFNEFFSNFVKI